VRNQIDDDSNGIGTCDLLIGQFPMERKVLKSQETDVLMVGFEALKIDLVSCRASEDLEAKIGVFVTKLGRVARRAEIVQGALRSAMQ
jgi:hypothetical protein